MQASSKVHRYTRDVGWVEDLPDMNDGRYGHGCAAFTMNQEQVRNHRHYYITTLFFIIFQIYLMAGGCRQWYSGFDVQCIEYLASTEIYHGGHWIIVEPLPVAVLGVRGASLDNTVYMTGSLYLGHYYKIILYRYSLLS